MSDLYCAATLVVARHAEAVYESELAWDAGGSLTLAGRDQARALAESLLHRKVASIWCSEMSRAVQTAEIAAAILGVPVRVRSGLREFAVGDLAGQPFTLDLFADVIAAWRAGDLSVGCPGAETGSDVVRRVTAELASVADEFRGETVLVVSHGGALQLTLPRLATNVSTDLGFSEPIDNVGTCELAADADGWVLKTWNGKPVEDLAG